MSREQPGKDRVDPELSDLPEPAQGEATESEVKGGRRVDFTEAYVNEVKLPSLKRSQPPPDPG